MVSKAFDKSRKTARVFSFLLNELAMLLISNEIACEVEWYFLQI